MPSDGERPHNNDSASIASITECPTDVCFTPDSQILRPAKCREGPCVDGSELARSILHVQHWSVQPCVRPLGTVHMTAGHNALVYQVRSTARIHIA
jgi:hypothetical protein